MPWRKNFMIGSLALETRQLMTPQQKKKLEKLLRALNEGQALIQELLQESSENATSETTSEFDARAHLATLKQLDRSAAEQNLGELKQHELGAVFVESGGPSADKKKPKAWLIEQILWRVFDFERGHDAIRSKGEKES